MSNQNKYAGTLIRGMAQVEDQLRYNGAQGNGIRELLNSSKGNIPDYIEKEIGKLVTIRNQVAHSSLILDEDDIEYIKKKLRKILEYFGEELDGDWNSEEDEQALYSEMENLFLDYQRKFNENSSCRTSNFKDRLHWGTVMQKGFSQGTMDIIKDILTDELHIFRGFDTTAYTFINLLNRALSVSKGESRRRIEETLDWLDNHVQEFLASPKFNPEYFSEEEIGYFFKHFKERGEKWNR